MKHLVNCAAFAVFALMTGPAAAQSGADFFNGKTVNYIVATDPGGGYDTNGRLVAEFMQKHLPGSTFVVRNMAGAGQIIGANYLYASQPDGLTIGTFNTGLIYNQLVENEAVRFDLTKMSWVGKLASDPRVIVVTKQSEIDSFEDLMSLETPIKVATAGVGTASFVETTMLVDALDMPVEIISGYEGGAPLLAMRRGEVHGMLGSRSSIQQFVDDGHGHFIVQIGGTATDVPQLADLIGEAQAAQAIALVGSQGNIARLTAGPPGIPQDRFEALRGAYAAAVSDPEFLERARSLGLPVEPLVGDDVADAVTVALDQTPEMVAFLKDIMN